MAMDERKQKILKAVVHYYVRTAEPVASEQISASGEFGVRSATIRNEMAALADLGYLMQPHTSAGRIPSDDGYRYYVNRLMAPSAPEDVVSGKGRAIGYGAHGGVEDLIAGTCRFLCAITQLTALAVAPTSEAVSLRFLEVRRGSENQLIVVTLWSNGQMRYSVLPSRPSAEASLRTAVNYLSRTLVGRSQERFVEPLAAPEMGFAADAAAISSAVYDVVCEMAYTVTTPEVFVDGTSYFARQPEFAEHSAMELVLAVLDDETTLARLLQAAAVGEQAQVVIGHENPLEPLRSCSLVAAQYGAGSAVRGSIGVCGPTRMDYDRVVAAVELVSRSLSAALAAVLPA